MRSLGFIIGVCLIALTGCASGDDNPSVSVQLVGADEGVRGNVKISRLDDSGAEIASTAKTVRLESNQAMFDDVPVGRWQARGIFAAAQDPLCGWEADPVVFDLKDTGADVSLPIVGFCS